MAAGVWVEVSWLKFHGNLGSTIQITSKIRQATVVDKVNLEEMYPQR